MASRKDERANDDVADDEGSNAVELLTRDHEEVDELFKQYDDLCEADADAEERRDLSTRICGMLVVHTMIEEEIFYPAAREAGVEDDLMDEAQVEHASAKDLITQIGGMSAEDELYDAKVKVLGEYVRHHVEEEEGEMFPKCEDAGMDLDELGARMAERKEELMAQLEPEEDMAESDR